MEEFLGMAGPMNMFRGMARSTFEDRFKCYSMVFFNESKADAEHGGKIILPPSALERLAHLNITYPMLFKLSNLGTNHSTHCGVLEFCAEEGRAYVPRWMLDNLRVQDGDLIHVSYVSLPLATFSKFQPQSVDFLDITNPKAVLELKLRLFACLSKGDVVKINYNNKDYELLVMETKPENAVSIIECDMKVDFAAPVGYKEPNFESMDTNQTDAMDTHEKEKLEKLIDESQTSNEFVAFQGQGQRLNGKTKGKKGSLPQPVKSIKRERGVPNYNYKKGTITFARAKTLKSMMEDDDKDEEKFTAFSGSGQQLKIPKSKRNKPRS